jgi:hypothetical protein
VLERADVPVGWRDANACARLSVAERSGGRTVVRRLTAVLLSLAQMRLGRIRNRGPADLTSGGAGPCRFAHSGSATLSRRSCVGLILSRVLFRYGGVGLGFALMLCRAHVVRLRTGSRGCARHHK